MGLHDQGVLMSDSQAKIRWRVHASDGQPRTAAFDALIIAANSAERSQLRPSRVVAIDIPFERELPDVALTLIVRANAADVSLVSEFDVFKANGVRRMYGRSSNALAVFVYSKRGIVVTGLGAPAPDSGSPPT